MFILHSKTPIKILYVTKIYNEKSFNTYKRTTVYENLSFKVYGSVNMESLNITYTEGNSK